MIARSPTKASPAPDRNTWNMLTFPLFKFPIQIHWSFAVVLLFVIDSELPVSAMMVWAFAVFVSVLIHELGHAFAARRYGGRVQSVMIYAMGGLTTWLPGFGGNESRHRVLISAAGSGIQILLGLIVFALAKEGVFGDLADVIMRTPFQINFWWAGYLEEYVAFFAGAFVWVSVFWGLINWVPVAGLDGSHMLRELMVKINPENGVFHAKVIGVIFALLLAVILFQQGFRFAPFLFLWFAIQDFTDQRVAY